MAYTQSGEPAKTFWSTRDWLRTPDAPKTEAAPIRLLPMEPLFARPLPRWKRALDVVAAALGLVLLSPVFALIALYIRAVSPGPVFFRQERVGHRGREFTLWKFRSMHAGADTHAHARHMAELIRGCADGRGAEHAPMRKIDRDPRIIPLGTWFRKSCLDELPQLFNVLRGDMSLIGPRPAIPYEVDEYHDWHKGRFDVVPGLSGLWQVSGKNDLSFKQMVELDIRYIRDLSVRLDALIFFKTFPAVFAQLRGRQVRRPKDAPADSMGQSRV